MSLILKGKGVMGQRYQFKLPSFFCARLGLLCLITGNQSLHTLGRPYWGPDTTFYGRPDIRLLRPCICIGLLYIKWLFHLSEKFASTVDARYRCTLDLDEIDLFVSTTLLFFVRFCFFRCRKYITSWWFIRPKLEKAWCFMTIYLDQDSATFSNGPIWSQMWIWRRPKTTSGKTVIQYQNYVF